MLNPNEESQRHIEKNQRQWAPQNQVAICAPCACEQSQSQLQHERLVLPRYSELARGGLLQIM